MSTSAPTVVERAFAIARSGTITSMTQLRQKLRSEGLEGVDAHLSSSPSLGRQLIALMRAAQPPAADAPDVIA